MHNSSSWHYACHHDEYASTISTMWTSFHYVKNIYIMEREKFSHIYSNSSVSMAVPLFHCRGFTAVVSLPWFHCGGFNTNNVTVDLSAWVCLTVKPLYRKVSYQLIGLTLETDSFNVKDITIHVVSNKWSELNASEENLKKLFSQYCSYVFYEKEKVDVLWTNNRINNIHQS